VRFLKIIMLLSIQLRVQGYTGEERNSAWAVKGTASTSSKESKEVNVYGHGSKKKNSKYWVKIEGGLLDELRRVVRGFLC